MLWEKPWCRSSVLHGMTDGRRGTCLGNQGLPPSPTMGCLCSMSQNTGQVSTWGQVLKHNPKQSLPLGWGLLLYPSQ